LPIDADRNPGEIFDRVKCRFEIGRQLREHYPSFSSPLTCRFNRS
jgi:hypothetical protein